MSRLRIGHCPRRAWSGAFFCLQNSNPELFRSPKIGKRCFFAVPKRLGSRNAAGRTRAFTLGIPLPACHRAVQTRQAASMCLHWLRPLPFSMQLVAGTKQDEGRITLRTLTRIAAASIALGSTPPATASTSILDGNSLYETCSSSEATSRTYCNAYIRGLYENVVIRWAVKNRVTDRLCVRSTITYPQITDIVLAHMRTHPEERDGFAFMLVERAIYDAFPECTLK